LNLSSRYFFKRSKNEISQNVKFFRHGLERSSGDSCDARLFLADNPGPEVRRDQANQWAEDCESNSDTRNYRSGKLLIGRARNALQTQLPPPGIELRNRSQLGLQSFHCVGQQTSQMLAPPRLLELIRDPRIIAAAVANATTALMNGLSAANQKLVFMLFISSVRRSTFQQI
jgi:hypothetical protein